MGALARHAATYEKMTRSKDDILQDLAREEARLADLERMHNAARTRLDSLRLELVHATASPVLTVAPPPTRNGKVPPAPGDKVRLFRSLFRGRPDLLATRFVSKRIGKAGYSPACSNKWAVADKLWKPQLGRRSETVRSRDFH